VFGSPAAIALSDVSARHLMGQVRRNAIGSESRIMSASCDVARFDRVNSNLEVAIAVAASRLKTSR
jgi:hypothetical protein